MQNATPLERILSAARKLDAAVWIASLCILTGWFFFETLHVSIGPLRHGVHFFDVAAIIGKPVRLFTGIDHAHAPGTLLFTLICCGVLLAPLTPYLWNDRSAWLAYLAPLILMLACGLLMYARTSGEVLATSNDPASMSNDIIRFANDLIHRGGDIAARKVSIAAGGYLALFGSALLALRGVQRYRADADKQSEA